MSEAAEIFNAMKDHKKAIRSKYGVECPECKKIRPKTNASILLPRQKCKVDGYRDPRLALTDDERDNV